ncbi:hypothetical protein [Minwuia sp.]|uniref:hypothetical protein n=1 Tax=Minwuia sp. TaxID=2493630 RepID=UPI003A916920
MAWTSKPKNLATTDTVGHVSSDPNIIGRVPANTSVRFTPLDLYGATARCSHLSFVNPSISTAESDTVKKLVEPHVDDISHDFAILASADKLKDFVKSYFTGTVATGLAYLAMINESYVWSDHFENAGGGKANHTRKPDFVFGGHGVGVALMESKGSRSGTLAGFDRDVLDGYTSQIEPHLGSTVGGAVATHGYCIGAWLKSTTKAELRVHYTKVPATPGGTGARPPLATIQRHNFATAFSLAHSPQLGAELRLGESRYSRIGFLRTHWRGRYWLTYIGLGMSDLRRYVELDFELLYFFGMNASSLPWRGPLIFAVEETVAVAALRTFLGRDRSSGAEEVSPLEEGVRRAAGEHRGEEDGEGAVFPDGLAILDRARIKLKFEPVFWDVRAARLLL